MKKIFLILATCVFAFSSCVDLEVVDWQNKNTAIFPRTPAEADQMMTGIYNAFNQEINDYRQSQNFISEFMSDDRFGGGGQLDRAWAATDKFMRFGRDMYYTAWQRKYQGIYRANVALTSLGNIENTEQSVIDRYMGEAHFLRAYFYFTLAQLFENVPLLVEPVTNNIPQAPVDKLYAQIAYDLQKAIELMPATKLNFDANGKDLNNSNNGRATRWAAQALLARVYLFYTGVYGTSSLPIGDGTGTDAEIVGEYTAAAVAEGLEELFAQSGHKLIPSFYNIWPYSNLATKEHWKWSQDNDLDWAGDGCSETIFAYKFGNRNNTLYSNQLVLAYSLRLPNGQEHPEGEEGYTFPWGNGWGAGPVSSALWDEWEKDEPADIRREGSIIDAFEIPTYKKGADMQVEETGYWQKKQIYVTAYVENPTTGELTFKPSYNFSGKALSDPLPDWNASFQTAATNDYIVIRLADALLMHAELTNGQTISGYGTDGMNAVRARAGLPAKPYSLANLQKERRYELAFEGVRYYDIMRWGIAEQELAKQEGLSVIMQEQELTTQAYGGGYASRFKATRGFLIIPESQIEISSGVLKQNPGWDGNVEFSDFIFQ
ncbi:MAG: RagB/SusD family nutrient uptake outer membrane protein [Mediterranea sp.]|jgi:hypothetical protein|nr:RagB/SusD family nutrient uptake outer membrane protein [Mediterranea sp.]